MRFLSSQALWTWAQNSKTLCMLAQQISIDSEMTIFELTNSNEKHYSQIM